jgi:S1-C subfamily serine protease
MGYQKLPAMVERVRRESLAEKAGIRPDDVILSVNGTNVSDPDEYDKRLALMRPGEALDLVVRRGRAIVPIRLEPERPR